MKLSTWALVGLLLAGVVGGFVAWRRATEPARAWAEFLELDGVDLRGLEGRRGERGRELFHRFLPLAAHFPPKPWMVLNLAAKGEAPRPLMLTLDCSVDGHGRIRQHVGAWLNRKNLGADEWFDAVAYGLSAAYEPGLGAWCLTVKMSKGGEDRTQVRAVPDADEILILPEEVLLIREEGEDGRAVPPEWSGFPVEQSENREISPQALANLLRAPPSARLLALLCWLGHRDRPKELLGRPDVRAALEELRASSHPWVREAAELALRP